MQAITLAACDMADSYVQAVQGADHLRQQMASYLEENASVSKELANARAEIGRLETRAAERIFSAIAAAGVNVRMIDQGSSEINIIIGVDELNFSCAIFPILLPIPSEYCLLSQKRRARPFSAAAPPNTTPARLLRPPSRHSPASPT